MCKKILFVLLVVIMAIGTTTVIASASNQDTIDSADSEIRNHIARMGEQFEIPELEHDAIYQVYLLSDNELLALHAPFLDIVMSISLQYGGIGNPVQMSVDCSIGRFFIARDIAVYTLSEFEQSMVEVFSNLRINDAKREINYLLFDAIDGLYEIDSDVFCFAIDNYNYLLDSLVAYASDNRADIGCVDIEMFIFETYNSTIEFAPLSVAGWQTVNTRQGDHNLYVRGFRHNLESIRHNGVYASIIRGYSVTTDANATNMIQHVSSNATLNGDRRSAVLQSTMRGNSGGIWVQFWVAATFRA